jgi:glycerol uptake facilitator-like aquaporin
MPEKASYFYPAASLRDLRSAVFWRDVASEMLAAAVLMSFVALVVISCNDHYRLNTTHFGFFALVAVYLLIEGYGPISGAQMNPAASISLFLAQKMSLARTIAYIVAQVAGTAAGSGLGYLMTPANKRDSFPHFDPELNGLTVTQGVLIEAFFTFNLVFVALSCHDTVNRSPPCVMPALPIASCIAIGLICAGTHSGGLMNPIIPLGPAILSKNFTNYWVYVVGPVIGGPLATGVYKLFIFIKVKFGAKPHTANNDIVLRDKMSRDDVIALLEKMLVEAKQASV